MGIVSPRIVSRFRFWGPLAAALAFWQLAAADTLETLDGESLAGVVQRIDEQGAFHGDGIAAGTKWKDLRAWRRAEIVPVERPLSVRTKNGIFRCDQLAIESDLVQATAGPMSVAFPLEAVSALILTAERNVPSIKVAMEKPLADRDQLIVKTDEAAIILPGLLTKLNDTEGVIEIDGSPRTIAREKILAIVLAQSPTPSKSPAKLNLVDGSSIPGTPGTLSGGNFSWRIDDRRETIVPLSQVAGIDFYSERIVYLSDHSSIKATEAPLVTFPRTYRRDVSVSGTVLKLGSTTFAKGIGVHAQSELMFDVPANAALFFVVVGIDADAGPRGDCQAKILLDGREVFSSRIKAGESPISVKVETNRARKLTLVVEAGEDLDLGDAVDWADARFLQKATGR